MFLLWGFVVGFLGFAQGGSWVRDVNDSANYVLYSNANQTAGDDMRVQFSNDLTTRVSVQVSGEWKSN